MAYLRVLAGVADDRQFGQQLAGLLAEQLGLVVDQLHLPFDAERRTAGRIPLDSQGRPPSPELANDQISPGWYSPHTSRSASQTSPRVASVRSASRSGYSTLSVPSA